MRISIILLSSFVWSVPLFGQYIFPDTLLSRIWWQTSLFPQEKLYIQTDKVDYMAGEMVWIRAFLTDASTHLPDYRSRYVYIELVNPFNKIEQRIRLRQDSLSMIHGQIVLSNTLAGGEYSIRAYTRYMQNLEEDYFFRKAINIISPYSKGLRMSLVQEEENKIRVNFTNPVTGEPMKATNTLLLTSTDTLYHTNMQTGIRAKINTNSLSNRTLLLYAGNYGQYINLPDKEKDFDVSFFPEGGQMVPECMNKIAFKALNNLGLGEEVRGEILTEEGDTITSFRSYHRGMGYVSLIPAADTKYIARCRNKKGKEKTVVLPQASHINLALKINRRQNVFYVSVLHSPSTEKTNSNVLIVHQRGVPKYVQLWDENIEQLTFNAHDFSNGVIHSLLSDNTGNIISERLAFNDVHQESEGKVFIDKASHLSRSKVVLQLKAHTPDGKLLNGNAAISVTNNYDTQPDTLNSILATMLLTSELRGFIEAPHWYFQGEKNKKKQEALEQLMLTQGWRRYDMQAAVKGQFKHPQYPHEESMSFKGKVKTNVLRKAQKNAQVRITAPEVGMVELTTTDHEGNFLLKGFEFPDSTKYLLSTVSKGGNDNITLQVAQEEFPLIQTSFPFIHLNKPEEKYAYITKMENKITLENGIRHIFLDEVLVTAPYKIFSTETEKVADKVIKESKLEQSGAPTLSMAINSIWGIYDRGGSVGYVLDDCELSSEEAKQILEFMPKESFEQIEMLRLPAAIRYFGGNRSVVILLYTKRGGTKYNATWKPSNLAYITPLGYQQAVEFYSPTYNNPQNIEDKLDLRTTIYWKPNVIFKDGLAEVSFYTADGEVDYTITVEGVANDGSLLRIQQQLK